MESSDSLEDYEDSPGSGQGPGPESGDEGSVSESSDPDDDSDDKSDSVEPQPDSVSSVPDPDSESDSDDEWSQYRMDQVVFFTNGKHVELSEDVLRFIKSRECTRESKFSRAAHFNNERASLYQVMPESEYQVLEKIQRDNVVPATEHPYPERPERCWRVTEANLENMGDIDAAKAGADCPASMEHILDVWLLDRCKPYHKMQAKAAVMSFGQGKLDVHGDLPSSDSQGCPSSGLR